MAKRKEEKIPQMKTNSIRCTSRASVKVRDNFYTVEYSEERVVPEDIDVDIDFERQSLWDSCNVEVDKQIEDILNAFKK